jgi:hypothetical protein
MPTRVSLEKLRAVLSILSEPDAEGHTATLTDVVLDVLCEPQLTQSDTACELRSNAADIAAAMAFHQTGKDALLPWALDFVLRRCKTELYDLISAFRDRDWTMDAKNARPEVVEGWQMSEMVTVMKTVTRTLWPLMHGLFAKPPPPPARVRRQPGTASTSGPRAEEGVSDATGPARNRRRTGAEPGDRGVETADVDEESDDDDDVPGQDDDDGEEHGQKRKRSRRSKSEAERLLEQEAVQTMVRT